MRMPHLAPWCRIEKVALGPPCLLLIDDERMMSFVHSHAVSGLILESYTTLPPSIQLGASKTFWPGRMVRPPDLPTRSAKEVPICPPWKLLVGGRNQVLIYRTRHTSSHPTPPGRFRFPLSSGTEPHTHPSLQAQQYP